MNKIPKNNINSILYEHKSDDDINNLFLTILPPNQNDIFLKIFLESKETQKRCLYSKKIFTFLLSLPQNFRDKINIINFTNSFDEFLSEIQDSQYLCDNFHFISRCVQQILEYIFLNHELGSFCLISYRAKLLNLECIPVLPLFFNQDQDIQQISHNFLLLIKPFLSKFDEKILIWCYIENMHDFFCKIINKKKDYVLDHLTKSIINERIETTEKIFHHNSTLFIDFLSLMYPSINQKYNNQQLLIEKSNSIDWINSFNENNDDNPTISKNIDQNRGFLDLNPPFKSIRHPFNISKLQIKMNYIENAPKSLPPSSKKLLKVQIRPKFELKIIPSIEERFLDSDLNIQGKILSENFELPMNFIIKDFNSTLYKLNNIGVNESFPNDDEFGPRRNDKNYTKHPSLCRSNKQKLGQKIKANKSNDSKKSPSSNNELKNQISKNNDIKNNYLPKKKNTINLAIPNSEQNQNNQTSLNKKIGDIKEKSDFKDEPAKQKSKLNITQVDTSILDQLSTTDDEDSSSSSSSSSTLSEEEYSEYSSSSESELDDETQKKIECNLSSYPSSNPPASNKKILFRKKPHAYNNLSRNNTAPTTSINMMATSNLNSMSTTDLSAMTAANLNTTTTTNNNAPQIMQCQQQHQNQSPIKIVVQKRNNFNNIFIHKNTPNQNINDTQSTKP